jgi:hypothetical protein
VRFRNIKVTAPNGSIIWQGPPDLSHLPPEEIDPAGQVSPPSARKIDLLQNFSAGTDALLGTWTESGDGLAGSGANAQVQFHTSLPDEYVYRVRFVRVDGNNPIALIASREGRSLAFVVGGHDGTISGFGNVDGASYDNNDTTRRLTRWISNGIVHTLVLRVRKDWMQAYLDGVQHDRVSEDSSNLTLPAEFRRDNSPPLVIWLGGDQVTVKSADLFELAPALIPAATGPSEK